MENYKELLSIDSVEIYDGTFSSIKDNVFIRLLNKKNLPFRTKLEKVLYKPFADLAITFSIEYKDDKNRLNTYMITNENFESFNIDYDIFYSIAINNLKKKNSVRIESMSEYTKKKDNNPFSTLVVNPMEDMMDQGMIAMSMRGKSSSPIDNLKSLSANKNIVMITNRNNTFGATNFIFSSVLETIHEKLEDNFYIVPLSIHEIMCIKEKYLTKDGEKSDKEVIEDLKDIIENVNDNNTENDMDILSYNIYYHMYEEKVTMIVK